jgi:hypothetical protein
LIPYRRDAGVVELANLESLYISDGIEGSNPSLSATPAEMGFNFCRTKLAKAISLPEASLRDASDEVAKTAFIYIPAKLKF